MEWQQYVLLGTEFLFLGLGTWFDVKNQELPVAFLLSFGALAAFYNLLWKYQSFHNILIGVCIGGVFQFVGCMTKEAIGDGAGYALVILGLFEGWEGMIPIVFFAFILSGIYGIWRLIGLQKSRDEIMPFFPFLLIALIGVILL